MRRRLAELVDAATTSRPGLSKPRNLDTAPTAITRITVLGIGNPIMGDDGIGLELLARLTKLSGSGNASGESGNETRPLIDFVDGGTSGMELLPTIQDAESLLLLDAVAGPRPGTVVTLVGDQVPRLQSGKLSPHQVGLLDLLSAARLLGREPVRVAVVGIVPSDIDLRIGLSPTVTAALPDATAAAAAIIADWTA